MAKSNRQFPSVTMIGLDEGLDARLATSNGYEFLRVTQNSDGKTVVMGKDGNAYVQKTKLIPQELKVEGDYIHFDPCWPEEAEEPITTYYLYVDGEETEEFTIHEDAETGDWPGVYELTGFEDGVYNLNITACQEGKRQSSLSNTAVYVKMTAPDFGIVDNFARWNEVVGAEKYVILYNNSPIGEVLASEPRSFDLSSIESIPVYQSGSSFGEIKIQAVNVTNDVSVTTSAVLYIRLAAPVVSKAVDTLTWIAPEVPSGEHVSTQGEYIIVDGEMVGEPDPPTGETGECTLDLTEFFSEWDPGVYNVQISSYFIADDYNSDFEDPDAGDYCTTSTALSNTITYEVASNEEGSDEVTPEEETVG